MYKSLSFFFVFYFSFTVLLQAQIELKNEQDSYVIGKSISYFKDPTTLLSLEDILSKQAEFTPSQQENINFGHTTDAIWVKCIVTNKSTFNDWVLSLNIHYINYIDFYYQENGVWKKQQTGTLRPFKTRRTNDVNFSFNLDIQSQSKKIYYLRFKTENPFILPLRIQRNEAFNDFTRLKNIYYGGYFGILLVMIFYNLFIYLSLRDKNYLYYVFTIVATLAVFSSSAGYVTQLILPSVPEVNILTTRLFLSLLIIAIAVFSIHFLQLKKYSRPFYKLMLFNIFLAILASILHQFTSWKAGPNQVMSFHVVVLIVAGIVIWRKGNPLAKYFLLAWTIYAMGGGIITLRNAGFLSSNLFTAHIAEVGSVFEIIIISFALSEKYRIFKQEKELANKRALQVQKEANEKLEDKVQERTLKLQSSLNIINKLYVDINASITYASRIQTAFLAIDNEVKKVLPEYFIFFKPRDVVSGDFYFFTQKNNKIVIVAADCTGHGIPGAMMSMIGDAYLSETVHAIETLDVSEILLEMHHKIRSALSQGEGEVDAIRDGMDMAICIIDRDKKVLEFAGAKRPLVYIQNNQVHEIKGSKLSIGASKRESQAFQSFEKHLIPIESELHVYLFTDGFQDQFGGEENRKFMSKNFKKLLLKNHKESPEKQKQVLEDTFDNWKGEGKQIDDVLVIGFKID